MALAWPLGGASWPGMWMAGTAAVPVDPAPTQAMADVQMGALPFVGHLVLPRGASRLVLCFGDLGDFGGGRRPAQLQQLAAFCAALGLATLQFDLVTTVERATQPPPLDADLQGHRLVQVLTWARGQSCLAGLSVGLLGAGTGAAAALEAAAARPSQVAAVVACEGRPDLPARRLAQVSAPTLLVVGAGDPAVLAINRAALPLLGCRRRLEVVPGGALVLNDAGALATVSALAGDWFSS